MSKPILTLFLICLSVSLNPNLEWIEPSSGTYFNIINLQRDLNNPWKVRDSIDNGIFAIDYFFNFGANHNKICKGQDSAVVEILDFLNQPTDACEIIGKYENATFEVIDKLDVNKGFSLTYGNGDMCTTSNDIKENDKPRKTKFIIECSENEDENVSHIITIISFL